MAGNSPVSEVTGRLKELTLAEFLQEPLTAPQLDNPPSLCQPAIPLGYYKTRSGRKWQSGNTQQDAVPLHPKRGSMSPGVMLTHDPPQGQLLAHKKQYARHQESVLSVGSHEAPSMKDRMTQADGVPLPDREAVLSNAQPQDGVSFVLNQVLSVSADQHQHFLPVPDIADVRRNTILKLLVGLLNTGERGVVYLGVEEDGKVTGVAGEAQMIAHFVDGLMKTVQFYLMPRLHVPQYGVRYTNVLTASGQTLDNLWVVELHAVPQMHYYYNAVMDMDYHIRDGTETRSLPFTDFCNIVVTNTSKPYETEISKLQQKVIQLRQLLEEKGIDTSIVGPHVCDSCWFNDCPAHCYGKLTTGISEEQNRRFQRDIIWI